MKLFRYSLISAALMLGAAAVARPALSDLVALLPGAPVQAATQSSAASGSVEYAFSPRGGAEALVLKVIDSSRGELRVMAYSLTSVPVVKALILARKRGVDVRVVADHKQNSGGSDTRGRARAALGALVNAGIQVRTVDSYSAHHDKVLVADGVTVQTGSFNYSAAAAKSNSENVIVLWQNPAVARGYLGHWERNWQQGQDWKVPY